MIVVQNRITQAIARYITIGAICFGVGYIDGCNDANRKHKSELEDKLNTLIEQNGQQVPKGDLMKKYDFKGLDYGKR